MKQQKKQQKTYQIIKILSNEFPERKTALRYKNKFQLLVATILSAQCTDVRVNIVTKTLFKKYPTINEFAKANPKNLAKDINSVTYFNSKSRYIVESAQKILKYFKGKFPNKIDDLIKLPGVGRKTANVVLSHAFNKNEGITVDTHVKRLSQRLGLTEYKDPKKIEIDLMKLIPKIYWGDISIMLILHGRKICNARKPKCENCILAKLCPSYKNWKN